MSGSVYKKPFAVSGLAHRLGRRDGRAAADRRRRRWPSSRSRRWSSTPCRRRRRRCSTTRAVDIDQWIADEVRVAFAEQEGTAFVTGDGVNKPKGFLTYPKVANASWTWGNIGFIATGVLPAPSRRSNPSDKLIDLVYAVKAGYRANAHFVMNRSTQAPSASSRTRDGNYLWQPAQQPGEQPTLMGYPVAETEDMPDIAADSLRDRLRRFPSRLPRSSIASASASCAIPTRSKPYVLFYTTKRVGGGVQDFDAIKLLKFAV